MLVTMSSKSNEKSEALRNEGNKFYSSRNFYSALLKYNECLCYAKPDSENVGLAYANRSAVYLETKRFNQSIRNIELAKQHKYPETSYEILSKREEKCKEFLTSEKHKGPSGPWNFFKLTYEPNKKLSFIVDCLKVKTNEKYGRHIITNRPLRVGDIIAIERPFCNILLSESKFIEIPGANIYQRCSHCLRENAMDLIPCSSCCKAMYCSTNCLEEALKRYHQFECSIMDQLLKSGSVHMATRLFFIALSTFDGSIENLKAFLSENDCGNPVIFDVDMKADNKDKSLLLALMSLMRSSKTFSLHQHREIFKCSPNLSDMWENHSTFIQNFLQSLCQISDLNFHGIFSGSQDNKDESLQQSTGSGALLFASLCNHSCSNNVLRICVEGKVAFVVCRPVDKGAQIMDCYKTSFLMLPKIERQSKLVKEFDFVCDCEACTKNFPTSQHLICKDGKLLKFAKKAEEEINHATHATKRYQESCDILEKNHLNYPSIELCVLQKFMAKYLLMKARPSTF